MFIDTHCHISSEYYDDINKVLEENIENNVKPIIISGCDKKGIVESINIADSFSNIFLAIGFHPSEVSIVSDNDLVELKNLIKTNKKVVALGEIGLDYYYDKDLKDEQKRLFRKQLDIAVELNVPVVIHSRDAVQDTIDILKEYNLKGVIHCFSGSYEVAMEYIKMGYLLGVGGVVTFKNSNLYKVIEKIDLKNIVLETDSPYLTPEPFRGTVNSSKYIPLIAKRVSEIKKCSLEIVEAVTYNNSCELFDLHF